MTQIFLYISIIKYYHEHHVICHIDIQSSLWFKSIRFIFMFHIPYNFIYCEYDNNNSGEFEQKIKCSNERSWSLRLVKWTYREYWRILICFSLETSSGGFFFLCRFYCSKMFFCFSCWNLFYQLFMHPVIIITIFSLEQTSMIGISDSFTIQYVSIS